MFATFEKVILTVPRSVMLGRLYASWPRQNFTNFNPRHRMKTIKPMAIVDPAMKQKRIERERAKEEAEIDEYKAETRKRLAQYGEIIEEANTDNLYEANKAHTRERIQFKNRLKRKRMMLKHFKEFLHQEINLLTWAEKENIRYLIETDPGEWNAEAISQAYPISAKGVQKVVKNGVRLKLIKDVIRHDKTVAETIDKIKSGEIPMTEELEQRLKIRDLIPIKIGDLGINPSQFIDEKPKTTGPFARLVAPPPKKDLQTSQDTNNNSSVKYIRDDSFYYNETEIQEELKPRLANKELRQILGPPGKRMTFKDFERKMERSKADSIAEDMKYMLDIHTNSGERMVHEETFNEDDSNDMFKITKYNPKEEAEALTVTVEGGENFVYSPDSGYQKPFESADHEIKRRIEIPKHLRKPGATYKVGNSLYDDEGNFILRVI